MKVSERFSSIPNRIRFIRELSGLTRKEFEKYLSVNASTITAWESGRITPRESSINTLVKKLKEINVSCSTNWVFYGDGDIPYIFSENLNDSLFLDTSQNYIFQEIKSFERTNPNNIVISVLDCLSEPFYSLGSLVGGTKKFDGEIADLLGNNCIIQLKDNTCLIRKLLSSSERNKYTLIPISNMIESDKDIIFSTHIDFAAKIDWHREIN